MKVFVVQAHGAFEGVIVGVYAKEKDAIAACARGNRECELYGDEDEEYGYLAYQVE